MESISSRRMLSRRQFNSLVVAGAAAVVSGCQSNSAKPSRADMSKPGWIDAHVHVWTPDVVRYPLAPGFSAEKMAPKSFTPEELFAHSKPAGVTRVVLIQMSFYQYDNRYMLDAMAAHPGVFSGVAIVDHHAPDVSQTMKQLAKQDVRGFRIHARGEDAAKWVTDDGMATLWKTARAEKLAVCPLINPTDLPHIDALCAKFPGTTVVIDHFARIGVSGTIDQQQLKNLCSLARYPDVHVKTSAFYALGKKKAPYDDLIPMIRQVVDAFGPNRLMWASDCPFQVDPPHNYADSIALIRDRIGFLSEADKTAMLRTTAERIFFS
jgi:predicted TIM-barrel fold metal-dependent hydrolase